MHGRSAGKPKFSIIKALNDEACKPMLDQFSERSYNKRHILFMPFQEENLIFIVKTGRLRVYLGLHGKEISLAILGPGDVYSTHTRAYVEALEDTTIMTSPIDLFLGFAAQHQVFIRALMGSIGNLMTGAISTIQNLYFNCTDKRVAVYFSEQAHNFGKEVDGGIYVRVGLTVDNIAKIVGSSRQTVSSLLSSMEKDGILKKLARGEYLITDIQELELLANSCTE